LLAKKDKIILKSPEEIRLIRNSCHLASDVLDFIGEYVKPGIDTLSLDTMIEEFMRSNGAVAATKGYRGYKFSSCISINSVICHGVPKKDVVIQNGDLVKVDVTTILRGYFGDNCRTYQVGEVSEEAKRLDVVTKECMDLGILECYPGNYLDNIGYVITKHAGKNGYSVVKDYCGHGVGCSFHEDPEVVFNRYKKDRGPILKPGMTFTIEPMINEGKLDGIVDKRDKWTVFTKDGKLSAQYEHTVLITNTGMEVLTDTKKAYPIT